MAGCATSRPRISPGREGATERNRLLRNAPHLVAPLRTMVPLYDRWGGTLAAVGRFLRRPVAATAAARCSAHRADAL